MFLRYFFSLFRMLSRVGTEWNKSSWKGTSLQIIWCNSAKHTVKNISHGYIISLFAFEKWSWVWGNVNNWFSYSSFLPAKGSRTALREQPFVCVSKIHCGFMLQVVSISFWLCVCVSLSAVHAGIAVLVLHLGVELLWLPSLQCCLWCQEKGEKMFESGWMSSTANAYIFCLHLWLETESERGRA